MSVESDRTTGMGLESETMTKRPLLDKVEKNVAKAILATVTAWFAFQVINSATDYFFVQHQIDSEVYKAVPEIPIELLSNPQTISDESQKADENYQAEQSLRDQLSKQEEGRINADERTVVLDGLITLYLIRSPRWHRSDK